MKLKNIIYSLFVVFFLVSCGSEKAIREVELEKNFKYNLNTITNVQELVAALIIESGEMGSFKEIVKNMEWKKTFSSKERDLYIVKYKNSKATVPVVKIDNNNFYVDIEEIECIGMNVMGENKFVTPYHIGFEYDSYRP